MMLLNVTKELMDCHSIPEQSILAFSKALERIFNDGMQALENGEGVSDVVKEGLKGCKSCVSFMQIDKRVIFGDDWKRLKNSRIKSVDIIALCSDSNDSFLLPIEGKLGMYFEYPGAKSGTSLSLKELEEKYDGCSKLLGNSSSLTSRLIVVVPVDGQEWMWYRIRNWNRIKNKIGKIFSCCSFDLLVLLGLFNNTKPIQCQANAYRTQLLQSEFEKVGMMSNVQLPPHDSCIGCGKCKTVCRDIVKRFAISMIPDENLEGSPLRPYVDEMSCKIGCRECEKTCPVLHSSI